MKNKGNILSVLILAQLAAPLPAFADRGPAPDWPTLSAVASQGIKNNLTVSMSTEGCSAACQSNKVIYEAAVKYCRDSAKQYKNNEATVFNTSTGFIVVAALGTALGVSSLASAKSWGTLGGTSGIAASWKSETDPITSADEKKLGIINSILNDLAKLAASNADVSSPAFALQAEAMGSKCAAPVDNTTAVNPAPKADVNTPPKADGAN